MWNRVKVNPSLREDPELSAFTTRSSPQNPARSKNTYGCYTSHQTYPRCFTLTTILSTSSFLAHGAVPAFTFRFGGASFDYAVGQR